MRANWVDVEQGTVSRVARADPDANECCVLRPLSPAELVRGGLIVARIRHIFSTHPAQR